MRVSNGAHSTKSIRLQPWNNMSSEVTYLHVQQNQIASV